MWLARLSLMACVDGAQACCSAFGPVGSAHNESCSETFAGFSVRCDRQSRRATRW
jgi:hypothetical protein